MSTLLLTDGPNKPPLASSLGLRMGAPFAGFRQTGRQSEQKSEKEGLPARGPRVYRNATVHFAADGPSLAGVSDCFCSSHFSQDS